jgi:hypothetical protein
MEMAEKIDDNNVIEASITRALAGAVTERDTQKLRAIPKQLQIQRLKIIPTPHADCPGCSVLYESLVQTYIAYVHDYDNPSTGRAYEQMKSDYRFHITMQHSQLF